MRGGEDRKIPPRIRPDGTRERHALFPVYSEMLQQICRSYGSLPNPRSMTMTEIRFFYNGMRAELHEATKPRKPTKAGK